ncbi:tRNA uracil 4-sulfurtransferase ThiI [Nanoarchaeota archaeon]
MESVLIHYGEIALKKKNKPLFEGKLVKNIKDSADFQKVKLKSLKKERTFVFCEFDSSREDVKRVLDCVFGIKYFCFIEEVDKDEKVIVEKVKSMLEDVKKRGEKSIAFKTKRADKRFPLKSPELNALFGEEANKLGLKVDYSNALTTIFVEIGEKRCFVYFEKIKGPGGLPVGSSGKVLCLLSGGIDSPVAARQIMRRGCRVEFLHVHNLREEEAKNSKMIDVVKILDKYQFKTKLHLVSYTNYEFSTMEKVSNNYDLVLFKHYLLKLAERFALRKGIRAIVTGDNLGQVASQTLENIRATSYSVSVPIFRPLLTYDKDEIVDLARKIGTYELSIKQYKDCCSILAKNPEVNTKLEYFKEVLEKIDVDKIVQESIQKVVSVSA